MHPGVQACRQCSYKLRNGANMLILRNASLLPKIMESKGKNIVLLEEVEKFDAAKYLGYSK